MMPQGTQQTVITTVIPQHHSSVWVLCFAGDLFEAMHDVLASLCYSPSLFLPSSGTASVLDLPLLVLFGGWLLFK